MAITVTLVDATPYRLRYLCEQDGAPGEAVSIPNDGFASPDLRTDILAVGGDADSGGVPLQALIRARLDGIGVIPPGALTLAQARALFNSEDAAGLVLTNLLQLRAKVDIIPRTNSTGGDGIINWSYAINVDFSGDPVIDIRSEAGVQASAILDFHLRHTYDL
jgi:hypothetical protein